METFLDEQISDKFVLEKNFLTFQGKLVVHKFQICLRCILPVFDKKCHEGLISRIYSHKFPEMIIVKDTMRINLVSENISGGTLDYIFVYHPSFKIYPFLIPTFRKNIWKVIYFYMNFRYI